MCVTYGETFLTDTKSYDSLYYEIIRATADFIKLSEYGNHKTKHSAKKKVTKNSFSLVNRSVTVKSRDNRTPSITSNEFYNIKLICNHFKPALDDWQSARNVKFPTPEQVMCKSDIVSTILV
jgi:hypothetical protein